MCRKAGGVGIDTAYDYHNQVHRAAGGARDYSHPAVCMACLCVGCAWVAVWVLRFSYHNQDQVAVALKGRNRSSYFVTTKARHHPPTRTPRCTETAPLQRGSYARASQREQRFHCPYSPRAEPAPGGAQISPADCTANAAIAAVKEDLKELGLQQVGLLPRRAPLALNSLPARSGS